MPPWLSDIIYPLTRWVHMVCMTLIVGGTLFFELVLPIAIEDMKSQDKLYVFARARLVFRWVIWISCAGLLVSGAISVERMWQAYTSEEFAFPARWAVAHIAVGLIAMAIALALTLGRQPPENPVRWMRLNLILLLVTIFVGSATRHFQLALRERARTGGVRAPDRPPEGPAPVSRPATAPSTPPAV